MFEVHVSDRIGQLKLNVNFLNVLLSLTSLWTCRLLVSPNEAREPVDINFMIPALGIMIWFVKSLIVDICEINAW